jgi:tight adherence protein C
MSVLALAAGLVAPLAVVLALAPSGALTRRAWRRTRVVRLPASGSAPTGPRATPLAPLLSALRALGRRIRRVSGRPTDPGADLQAGTAAAVGALSAFLVSPVVALPAAAAVWIVPTLRRRRRRLAHDREVRGALPDTVDLFRLAVGAGMSAHQAVDGVARHAPAPVDLALAEVQRRVELGERLGDAIEALDALGDPVLPLVAALRGAARHGAPLGDALERVAADARVVRRRRAEEDARRLPVQLLFPLVLCVLPAFGLLAVVPLLLASLRSLQL